MENDRLLSSIRRPAPVDDATSSTRRPAREPLRVAIVGAGKMGANHARAVANCAVPARVIAIADASEAALESLSAVTPAARFGSLAELLAGERIDVVHICTPPGSHGSLAVEALEAGCHVYVEKPFAHSTTEAERMLGIANSRGLKVAAGHQLLFESPTRVAAQML